MPKYIGSLQKKILLLLEAGIGLAFAYTPGQRRMVYRELHRELTKIDRFLLRQAVNGLYRNKLIDLTENNEGVTTITLSDGGRRKVLSYALNKIQIKIPHRWDKRWRVVICDIPESIRNVRDYLRGHFKRLGFYRLQKSVFVLPYECRDEIEFLIEFYGIRRHVRQIIATTIDNELHLKNIFNLS